MKVYEIKNYIDGDTGQAITEMKSLTDSKFQGTAQIVFNMPDGRKIPQPANFVIEAKNLEEAFEKFKPALDAHMAKLEENRKKAMSKIQIAQSVPDGKIVNMFEKK